MATNETDRCRIRRHALRAGTKFALHFGHRIPIASVPRPACATATNACTTSIYSQTRSIGFSRLAMAIQWGLSRRPRQGCGRVARGTGGAVHRCRLAGIASGAWLASCKWPDSGLYADNRPGTTPRGWGMTVIRMAPSFPTQISSHAPPVRRAKTRGDSCPGGSEWAVSIAFRSRAWTHLQAQCISSTSRCKVVSSFGFQGCLGKARGSSDQRRASGPTVQSLHKYSPRFCECRGGQLVAG